MRSSAVGAILAAAVLAGACKGDSKRPTEPDPTVPTAVTTVAPPTTTAAADPFAVPTTIDAPYVQRVLGELNRVYGDMVRKVVETNTLDRVDLNQLGAIFNPPLLQFQIDLFKDIPASDHTVYKQPIGHRQMLVDEILTGRKDCISAKVTLDYSEVLLHPPPAKQKFIALTLKPGDSDPAGVNRTPWAMVGESNEREDPCAA